MTVDYDKYFLPEKPVSSAPQQQDFDKYFTPERTVKESVRRDIGRTAKSVAAPILGGYGDIQDLLLSLTSKVYGVDPEKVKERLQKMAEEDQEIPSLMPSTSEIKKSVEEIAPSLKPETAGEKTYEETLELGSTLANPLMGGAKIGRAAVGALTGMLVKKGAENIGVGETGQELAKNIASIIPLVVSGKITPTTTQAKELYEAGKRAGLTDKQLAPLMTENWKLASLGKFAKQSPEITKRMSEVESTLGEFYKTIKKSAAQEAPYSSTQIENLGSKMQDISDSWKRTLKAAPDKEAAIKFVDEAIANLKTRGATPESLINFYQDINAAVNWRAIKGGKKELSEIKNLISSTLKESSPKLAKDFESANKLWSKLEKFRKEVGWGETLEKYAKFGEFAPLLFNLATFNIPGAVKVGAGIAGAEAIRKIATAMLTNPSFQNISRNTLRAAKTNSPKIAQLAYNQLKEVTKKEFPEEYKQINWP
jgi:hypothetical protein